MPLAGLKEALGSNAGSFGTMIISLLNQNDVRQFQIMKKPVTAVVFRCSACSQEHELLEWGYHSKDFTLQKSAFRSDYLISYLCGSRSVEIRPDDLYLAKREIDQEEPEWATAMLLKQAALRRATAQWYRDRGSSFGMMGVADIREKETAELIRIACEGSGNQKVEALYRH